MKKIITIFLLLFSCLSFSEEVTGNLITGTFSNTTTTNSCGGTSGGTQAAYLGTTGIICWGYVQSTIAKTIAINQALSGSGVKVGGYNYSWDYYNSDSHRGTLSAIISLKGSAGQTLESYNYNMNDDTDSNWKTMSGTQDFTQKYSLANVSDLNVSFTGKDSRFWAGWYGPAIRNVNIGLKYTTAPIDPCLTDTLSSPSCPGYAEAYFTQQCSSNPLYAVNCFGYAQAYYTQQCSISPLYDSGCPGYAQAYFSQQCSLNALYNKDCPGYAEAYFNQQCSLNALYNSGCPGYAQAYFSQQCELDGLYNTKCPNYSIAYAKKTLFEQQGIASSVDIAGTTAKNDPANTTTSLSPTTTSSSTSSQPETTSVTSTTSVSPAAVVSVVKSPEPVSSAQQVQQPQPQSQPPQQQAQRQQEERKTENQVANKIEKNVGGGNGPKGDTQKMKEAVAKVQKEIAKEAQEAKTHEAQVATQGLVVGSMNFVPGFDAYKNAIIPDTNAILMAKQYAKPVIDNQRAQRRLSGASELKWQEMVDSQYKIGN